jgi:uncharacterized repeat protein (TIGR02543 family)
MAIVSVTFNGNGATGGSMGVEAQNTPTVPEALTLNAYTRTGYSFSGWNTAADGSGTGYADGATYSFASSMIVYAQWTPLPSYTVSFNANGGTGTMAAETANVPTALTANGFSRAGYTYAGWNTAADGSGTGYGDGATYPFTASVTLYAQWTAAYYTANFNPNGGTGSMASETANAPTALTPNAYTRAGYVFSGWNTAPDGSGVGYANGSSYAFTANVTLYAQWTIAYTITFDPNGGSGYMSPEVAALPFVISANTFTRTAYTFTGWNTAPDGSGVAYAPGGTYNTASNVQLYAQWVATTYTITFNANGGAGTMANESGILPISLTPNAFTRVGYAFTGWNTAADGSGTSWADGASYTAAASTTLYAQWIPPTAPSSPTLSAPVNGSYDDAASGVTFAATYNSTDTQAQSAYALRLKLSGGVYGYWNGTDFSSTTPVWNAITTAPGATFSVVVPSGVTIQGGTFVDGHVYNWSFASQEAGASLQGSFAPDNAFTAQAVPVVTAVTTPTGTSTITSPTVNWTETVTGVQTSYRVIVESGAYGTTPGSGATEWDSGVVSSASQSVGIGKTLSAGNYRVFVKITETGGQPSAWAYSTFTEAALDPAVPTISAVSTFNYATGLPEISITVQGNDNQLTANQASFETDTTGWAAGANTTLGVSSTWSQIGAKSMTMTASVAGSVSASTPSGVAGVTCSSGQVMRGMALFHSPTTARAVTATINFYDDAGTLLSSVTSPTSASTITGGATGGQAFITATAPAGTAWASLTVQGNGLGASEILYVDCALLAPGDSTTWSAGGFVGTTTATILRSDGLYVRMAGWPANALLAIPSSTQLTDISDVEAIPGVPMVYTAVITAPAGPVSSSPAVSAPVTMALLGWDIMDPWDPTNAVAIEWAGDTRTFDKPEQQGVFQPLGRRTTLVVRGELLEETFDLSMTFGGDNDRAWKAFNALRERQVTVMLRGDMPDDIYYVALGSSRPAVLNRTGDRRSNPSRTLTIRCNPVERP